MTDYAPKSIGIEATVDLARTGTPWLSQKLITLWSSKWPVTSIE